MIRTWAIIALLAVALGLAVRGQALQSRALQAETALASATVRLAQVEVARFVHEKHVAVMASLQATYDALAAEFETMEGADAPLSDYLRAVDQRLQ